MDITTVDCRYCGDEMTLFVYVHHLANRCKALSTEERARAKAAAVDPLFKCFLCPHIYTASDYRKHIARKNHPPIETHILNFHHQGELVCYCPFHPSLTDVSLPFAQLKKHATEQCENSIQFIAMLCRPPADFPKTPQEGYKYWLANRKALLPVKKARKKEPRVVKAEKKSQSIYKTAQGGLCNGD